MKETMTEKNPGQFTLNDAEFRIQQVEKETFHHWDRLEKRIDAIYLLLKNAIGDIEKLENGRNAAIYDPIDILENNMVNLVIDLAKHIAFTKETFESLNTIIDNRLNALTAAMNWGDKKREDEQQNLTVTVSADGAVEVKR